MAEACLEKVNLKNLTEFILCPTQIGRFNLA